jgi:hypothetical protein
LQKSGSPRLTFSILPDIGLIDKIGVEIKILKKIFTPEQAQLFMELTFEPETVAIMAKRTGIRTIGIKSKT